jgi:hypothetical protein
MDLTVLCALNQYYRNSIRLLVAHYASKDEEPPVKDPRTKA